MLTDCKYVSKQSRVTGSNHVMVCHVLLLIYQILTFRETSHWSPDIELHLSVVFVVFSDIFGFKWWKWEKSKKPLKFLWYIPHTQTHTYRVWQADCTHWYWGVWAKLFFWYHPSANRLRSQPPAAGSRCPRGRCSRPDGCPGASVSSRAIVLEKK